MKEKEKESGSGERRMDYILYIHRIELYYINVLNI
jgi:hypothetical protein